MASGTEKKEHTAQTGLAAGVRSRWHTNGKCVPIDLFQLLNHMTVPMSLASCWHVSLISMMDVSLIHPHAPRPCRIAALIMLDPAALMLPWHHGKLLWTRCNIGDIAVQQGQNIHIVTWSATSCNDTQGLLDGDAPYGHPGCSANWPIRKQHY